MASGHWGVYINRYQIYKIGVSSWKLNVIWWTVALYQMNNCHLIVLRSNGMIIFIVKGNTYLRYSARSMMKLDLRDRKPDSGPFSWFRTCNMSGPLGTLVTVIKGFCFHVSSYCLFLAFNFCRFCVVIRLFHPRYNGQWPPTSTDFLSQILPITLFFLS